MSYGLIATLLFSSMMLLLLTGQRIFAVIGFVGAVAAVLLWGEGGVEIPFTAIIKVMKWYPLLTLPLFVFMGYMLAESRMAGDTMRQFVLLTRKVEQAHWSELNTGRVMRFLEEAFALAQF